MPDTGAASAAGTATDGAAEGSRHRHRSQGEGEKHESHAGPPPSTSGVLGESSSVLLLLVARGIVSVRRTGQVDVMEAHDALPPRGLLQYP